MKRRFRRIAAVLVLAAAAGALAVSLYIGQAVFEGMTMQTDPARTAENSVAYLQERGLDPAEFERKYEAEKWMISSGEGEHAIPAWRLGEKDARKAAVLVHGLGGDHRSVYPVAEHFLQMGYQVLVYDQARSGESTAPRNTFGYLESRDLLDCVRALRKRIGEEAPLVVWATSYGAATAGLAAGTDDRGISALILDSPVADNHYLAEEAMQGIAEETGVPAGFLLGTGECMMRLRLGFGFDKVYIPDALEQTSVPLLIAYSDTDSVTPPFMAQALYDASAAPGKQIQVFPGATHAELAVEAPAEYRRMLEDFLQ